MAQADTQFKPGQPRPPGAGRRPGSPNKKTLAIIQATRDYQIAENAAKLAAVLFNNFSLLQASYPETREGQIQFAKDTHALAVGIAAFRAHHDLLEFAFPKQKRIENFGEVTPATQVTQRLNVTLNLGTVIAPGSNGHGNGTTIEHKGNGANGHGNGADDFD